MTFSTDWGNQLRVRWKIRTIVLIWNICHTFNAFGVAIHQRRDFWSPIRFMREFTQPPFPLGAIHKWRHAKFWDFWTPSPSLSHIHATYQYCSSAKLGNSWTPASDIRFFVKVPDINEVWLHRHSYLHSNFKPKSGHEYEVLGIQKSLVAGRNGRAFDARYLLDF